MNIYLVRHGQTDRNKGIVYGDTNIELNETGLLQADLVGKRLKSRQIQKIYGSDSKRAVQTAKAIRDYTGAALEIHSELREIDMGEWEGVHPDEVKITHTQYYKEWIKHLTDMPYPGGECGNDVVCRIKGIIDEILSSSLENIVIVSHGGVIKILLSAFLQLPLEKRFFINIENCSISSVSYDSYIHKFTIQSINDTAHFEGLKFV